MEEQNNNEIIPEVSIDPFGDAQFEIADAKQDARSVMQIINELYANTETAQSPTFRSNKVILDKETVLGELQLLKNALPEQLARADQILEKSNETLIVAKEEASAIVEQARNEANNLVDSDVIVRIAKNKANDIVANAEITAKKMKAQADLYCDNRLKGFSADIENLLSQVNAGRTKLYEALNVAKEEGLIEDNS